MQAINLIKELITDDNNFLQIQTIFRENPELKNFFLKVDNFRNYVLHEMLIKALSKKASKNFQLICKNCELNAIDENGESYIHWLALRKDKAYIKKNFNQHLIMSWVKNNCNINIINIHKLTPLHLAAESNNIDLVNDLVRNNAVTSFLTENNDNYLHILQKNGNFNIENCIFRFEDLLVKNNEGKNLITYTTENNNLYGFDNALKTLFDYNNNLNLIYVDNQANNILHDMVANGKDKVNIEIFKLLKFYGLDFNIVNSLNETPLDIAVKLGKCNLAMLLKQFNAKTYSEIIYNSWNDTQLNSYNNMVRNTTQLGIANSSNINSIKNNNKAYGPDVFEWVAKEHTLKRCISSVEKTLIKLQKVNNPFTNIIISKEEKNLANILFTKLNSANFNSSYQYLTLTFDQYDLKQIKFENLFEKILPKELQEKIIIKSSDDDVILTISKDDAKKVIENLKYNHHLIR